MLRGLVVAALCLTPLAASATAEGAAVGVNPAKACFRSGETTSLGGIGFTPNSAVNVTGDGSPIGTLTTDGRGIFSGSLTIGLANGEKVKTYTATDQANPAISASTGLRVSALDVGMRPRRGRPGRRVRIKARGFTTGKRLYAHIRRGRRYRRNIKIGRLGSACRKLSVRKRMFSSRTHTGVYTVQFDTKRRYSQRTKVRVRFSVTVFHTLRASAAVASSTGESWVRIR